MFDKGLHRDNHPRLQPPGTWRDMKNGVVSDEIGAVMNEIGTVDADATPAGYNLIGHVLLDNEKIILFAVTNGGDSQIIEFNTSIDSIDVLVDDVSWAINNKLNFPVGGYIEAEFRINPSGERIIYWTDDVNPPRFLNLDTLDPNRNTEIDTNNMKLFPEIASILSMSVDEVNSVGGALKTGSYQFAFAYVDQDLTETNYFFVSNPIPVISYGTTIPRRFGVVIYNDIDGAANDTDSSSSIKFTLAGLDTNYEWLRIAVIKDGNVVFLPDIFIPSDGILTYIHTGLQTTTAGSLLDVNVDKALYNTAKTLKQLDGILYLGNLSKFEDIGYQKYANNIKVESTSKDIKLTVDDVPSGELGYRDGVIAFDSKSFRRDEAYALYISWILKDGSESKAYHIPGRRSYSGSGLATGTITINTNAPSAIAASKTYFDIIADAPSQGAMASGSGYLYSSFSTGDTYVIKAVVSDGFTTYETPSISIFATDTEADITSRISTALNALPGFSTDWTVVHHVPSSPAIRIDANNTGDQYNGWMLIITDIPDAFASDDLVPKLTSQPSTSGGVDDTELMTADTIVVTSPFNPDINVSFPQIAGLATKESIAQAYVNALNGNSFFATEYIAEIGSIANRVQMRASIVGTAYNAETATITVNSDLTISPTNPSFSGGRDNAGDSFGVGVSATIGSYGSATSANISGQESKFSIASKLYDALVASGPVEYTYAIQGNVITVTAAAVGSVYNVLITVDDNDTGVSMVGSQMSGGFDSGNLAKENLALDIADYPDIFPEISSISGQKQFHFVNLIDPIYKMGYWENATEVYPGTDDFEVWDVVSGVGQDTGDDIKGEPVRHHRFPGHEDSPFYQGSDVSDNMTVLGFKLTNVKIPDDLKERVLGYKIYFAKRVAANRTVFDQGYGLYGEISGGDLIPQPDATDPTVANTFELDYLYFHPFRAMRTRFSVAGVRLIKAIINCDRAGGPINHGQNSLVTRYLTYVPVTDLDTNRFQSVKAGGYVEVNSNTVLTNLGFDNDFNNALGESKLVIQIENDIDFIDLGMSNRSMHNYIWNLMEFKLDLYNAFHHQELAHTGYIHTDLSDLDSDEIYGGDTFIGYYSYKASDNNPTIGSAALAIHSFVLESNDNMPLRHENQEPDAIVGEIFYPKSSTLEVILPDITDTEFTDVREIDNYFAYNEAYSSLNDIKTAFPDILSVVEPNEFPTRIIRSQQDNSSNLADPFRVFLPEDFKDLPRNRGELIHLESANNILIPHMERGLIRTKGREEITVQDVRAFIGAGDIFVVPPDEIIPTDEGYGGLQHPQTSLITPYGYFFADADSGKVFLLSSQLSEISSLGMKNFFRDNLKPSSSGTLRAVYDPFYKRIILTKFDSPNSWTISFLPEQQIWVSFHDYIPDYYFSNLTNFYSLYNQILRKHCAGFRGLIYESNVTFEIEYVHNDDPNLSKIANTLFINSVIKSVSTELNETFSTYQIQNESQDTGQLSISSLNARRTERIWAVNSIRDSLNQTSSSLPAWTSSRRLEDFYHKIRLRFVNNNGKTLYLHDSTLQTSKSTR